MNAIILAAGLGSRLRQITTKTHKALLKIDNEINIERTIRFLKEIGVEQIYIVVGYKADDFSYLVQKFGVNLIKNDKFQTLNNLYSFSLALPYFGDSFIIDADVVMLKNVLCKSDFSAYYTTLRELNDKNDWVVTSKNERIIDITPSNKNKQTLFGISYFTKDDARKIIDRIKTLPQNAFSDPKLYYDNVFVSMLEEIVIKQICVDNKFVAEIDDMSDLANLERKIKEKK